VQESVRVPPLVAVHSVAQGVYPEPEQGGICVFFFSYLVGDSCFYAHQDEGPIIT